VIPIDIRELNNYYQNLSFYKKWFFPRELGKALNALNKYPEVDGQESLPPPLRQCLYEIYLAYYDNTNFFTRWLFSGIHEFSQSHLTKICEAMDQARLITSDMYLENLLKILTSYAERLPEILTSKVPGFEKALDILLCSGLLEGTHGEETFLKMINSDYPDRFANLLETLSEKGLFSGEEGADNYRLVIEAAQDTRRASFFYYLPLLVNILKELNLVTHGNLKAFINDKFPGLGTLLQVRNEGFLTEAIFSKIVTARNRDFAVITTAIPILIDTGLKEKCQALVTHSDTFGVARALLSLHLADLLRGQAGRNNFDNLLQCSTILCCHQGTEDILSTIPSHLLTQDYFNSLINLCAEYQTDPTVEKAEAIRLYVGNHIKITPSTHTASMRLTDLPKASSSSLGFFTESQENASLQGCEEESSMNPK
jgi:hypothetical protein